jgi:hypothetical protein
VDFGYFDFVDWTYIMRIVSLFLISVALAFAQYQTIPPSGYPALNAVLNGKLAYSSGSGAPTANCVPGADVYTDTAALKIYHCTATPNVWVEVINAVSVYANPSWLSSLAWTKISGVPSFEPAIAAGTTAQYWRGDKTWQTLPTGGGGSNTSSNVGTLGVGVFDSTVSVNFGFRNLAPASSKVTITLDGNHNILFDIVPANLGLQAALGYTPENIANKGANSGYAALDGSGNVLGKGFISSGSGAGAFMMTQGSVQTPPANTVGLQAPASVPTSFNCTWWGVPTSGLVHVTATTPCILSPSPVDLAADTNATLLPLANLPTIPYSQLSGTPTIPVAQVNSDWNAVSGLAQILNKPTIPSVPVTSVLGRTGAVVATSGDYTTAQITEATNLYFTSARAVAAMSGLYQTPIGFTPVNVTSVGAASGIAPLGATAQLPIANLPNPIVTAGVGGVTANLLAAKDSSSPTRYILPGAGGCGTGFASATAIAGATFQLYSMPGLVLTAVADTAITSGDILIGGTTPGRVADSLMTGRSGIPSTTCIVGVAQTSQATIGGTFTLLYDGVGAYGTLVSASTPYSCTVSAVSSIACTHNLGTVTPLVSCWDSINNLQAGSVGSAYSVTAIAPTSSNVATLTFSGSATGSCIISTGAIGPAGAAGSNGAAGATGPAGPVSSYPGAGVALSTGSAWGTSYTVGTAASNLVQLNGSSQLPAVSAALLTGFPTLNQGTTGNAATATALAATPTLCATGQAPTGVLANGNATGCASVTGSSGVSGVTATSPVVSSGGTSPVISLTASGTRRTCIIDNDTQSSTALIAAQFSGRCVIPGAATIVEVDLIGGTGVLTGTAAAPTVSGTGSIQIGKYTPNGGTSTTGLLSVSGTATALATASGKACALTATSGTCINGNTSSSTVNISTTALSAGDVLYVSGAAADGAQTWYNVTVIYTVN